MKLCGFDIGLDQPLFLIAGPCVIESLQLQLDVAGRLKEITDRLGVPFIFKSSFDKANRSSANSFRGPGLEEGLRVLEAVKRQIGVPVLTDVHEYTPLDEVAARSEEHTSELQSLMRISYAVFCLKKTNNNIHY